MLKMIYMTQDMAKRFAWFPHWKKTGVEMIDPIQNKIPRKEFDYQTLLDVLRDYRHPRDKISEGTCCVWLRCQGRAAQQIRRQSRPPQNPTLWSHEFFYDVASRIQLA